MYLPTHPGAVHPLLPVLQPVRAALATGRGFLCLCGETETGNSNQRRRHRTAGEDWGEGVGEDEQEPQEYLGLNTPSLLICARPSHGRNFLPLSLRKTR